MSARVQLNQYLCTILETRAVHLTIRDLRRGKEIRICRVVGWALTPDRHHAITITLELGNRVLSHRSIGTRQPRPKRKYPLSSAR